MSWPLSVKHAAENTFAQRKYRTFQSIIYPAEEKELIGTSNILAWGKSRVGLSPPFIEVHPHGSFRVAYPLIDASRADAKTVKVERIVLQNVLSLDQTAYCLQIELSE